MEPNFTADEFSRLSPSERVAWCRQMAGEAELLAKAAGPRLRMAYADLAKQWAALADEIECEISRKL